MFKFKPLQNILIWLSIIGKDNLSIVHNQKSQFFPIFLHAFRLIHLFLLISTLIHPFQNTDRVLSISKYAVNYLSFNIVAVNTVDIIASWLHAKSIMSIVVEIEESLDTLNTFTDLNVRIALFVRDFRQKCYGALLIFLVEVLVRLAVLSEILTEYTYIIVTIAVCYKNIEIFYVTFYIDVQTFILSTLNENLNTIAIDCVYENPTYAESRNEEKLQIMHRAQIIYLNVWKISEHINKRFGGFLLSTCIGTVIILIYAGTSSFDILMKSNNKLDVLRE